jgi:hypothetical protein
MNKRLYPQKLHVDSANFFHLKGIYYQGRRRFEPNYGRKLK